MRLLSSIVLLISTIQPTIIAQIQNHCVYVCQSLECSSKVKEGAEVLSACVQSCETSGCESKGTENLTRPDHFYHQPLNLDRTNFSVTLNQSEPDVVRLSVPEVPDAVLVYVEYRPELGDWQKLTAQFAVAFPIDWSLPSPCSPSYSFRAAAVHKGVFGRWTEEVVVPNPSPSSAVLRVLDAVYQPDRQWQPAFGGAQPQVYGTGSVRVELALHVQPTALNDDSRFALGRTSRVIVHLVSCAERNMQPQQHPQTIAVGENGTYVVRVPAIDMLNKCKFSIMFEELKDTACDDRPYRLPALSTQSLISLDEQRLKEPECFSMAFRTHPFPTAIEYGKDGLADVHLRWNMSLEVSHKLSEQYDRIEYFRVYYGRMQPGRQLGVFDTDLLTPTHGLTTCYQPFDPEIQQPFDCQNSDWNITLSGLKQNTDYGVYACAIFDRAHFEVPPNQLAIPRTGGPKFNTKAPYVPGRSTAFYIASIGAPVVLVVVGLCITSWLLLRRGSKQQQKLKKEMSELRDNYYKITPHDLWECQRSDVQVYEDVILGKGAFGVVYKGRLLTKARAHKDSHSSFAAIRKRVENCDVAVKRLPGYATEPDKEKFLAEIALMKRLAQDLGFYEHIVNPLSCVTGSMPYCLIMEYCSHGNLLDFLRERRNYMLKLDEAGIDYTNPQPGDNVETHMILTARTLVQFAVNVCYAMEHIAAVGYVHRDLAARNILVDSGRSDGSWFAKVADFGMTRKVDEAEPQYLDVKGGKVPIKWLAVESLMRGEYSVKTDVWSFGVLLFEIMSLGGSPYPTINPHDLLKHLEAGHRMSAPEHCEQDIYQIMLACWTADAKQRPAFSDLREKLSRKYEEITEDYNYIPSINGQADYYHAFVSHLFTYPLVSAPSAPPPIETKIAIDDETPAADDARSRTRCDSGIDELTLTDQSGRLSSDPDPSADPPPPSTTATVTPTFYLPKTDSSSSYRRLQLPGYENVHV